MADNILDDAYELPSSAEDIPAEWQNTAAYKLELPARCPYCREPIRELRALRLTRTPVVFNSTLPPGGCALICPLCEKIVSAQLTGRF